MDTDCEHKRLEEGEGYVFCVDCGEEIEKLFGCSRGFKKKKVKKYYCDKCNKSFLKDSGLQRHLKSKNH